jgi:hypothetical protein
MAIFTYFFGYYFIYQARTIAVSVTSLHHGQTTTLLRIAVNPRPFPVHRTLRFFHAENEYLRASLPAPPASAGAPTSMQVGLLKFEAENMHKAM